MYSKVLMSDDILYKLSIHLSVQWSWLTDLGLVPDNRLTKLTEKWCNKGALPCVVFAFPNMVRAVGRVKLLCHRVCWS
jgi:hypothetical protein